MPHQRIALALFALTAMFAILIGCESLDPAEVESPDPAPVHHLSKSANSVTLVPDWDVTNTGWVAYPDAFDSLYQYIDEGVENQPEEGFIYTWINGAEYRCEFTDMGTSTAVDVSSIDISTIGYLSRGNAIYMRLVLSLYINDQLVDSEEWFCDGSAQLPCGGLDFSTTFDGFCYDASDINTMELGVEVSGAGWDQGHSQGMFTAIDAIVNYDEVCDPTIQNLAVQTHGDNFAVTFSTPCDATSEVVWGYSEDALTNSVTGNAGTSHILNFTRAPDEGCVYLMVVTTGATCSALTDTSALQTVVKDIVISNVDRVFNPTNCTLDVTWDTNVKSSSKIYWGTSCTSLTNTGSAAGMTTSHSVSIDASNMRYGTKVFIKAESENGCDSAISGCGSVKRWYCIQGP